MESKVRFYKPMGARLLVDPITTSLSLEERGERVGLAVVVEHENRPRPTMGKVVALGPDPLMRENLHEGEIVFYAPHAGFEVQLTGRTYRVLDFQDVTGVTTLEEALTEEEKAMLASREATQAESK